MKVTIRIDFAQKIKRYEHIYALMTAFEENKKPPKKKKKKKETKVKNTLSWKSLFLGEHPLAAKFSPAAHLTLVASFDKLASAHHRIKITLQLNLKIKKVFAAFCP